jgi:prepilin-type N-terminal cleavage/methylation domain-containing protein/prepilin-type processing-associated H-X9-DG protein
MTTHRRPRGFTLVEMLVVLGIIVLLMGMLLPVLTAAKRQSRKTACEARLHVIGQALQMYLGENDDTLPPACSTNSLDSLQSRVGTTSLHCTSPGVLRGFVPPTDPNNAKYFGPPGFAMPMAPIAYYLRKSAPVSDKIWSCPAIRNGFAGLFRTYQYVETGRSEYDPNLLSDSTGPLAGNEGFSMNDLNGGEWRPGYQYMGGAEYWWSITSHKDEANRATYHYDEFATRNIGGLRLEEIKPQGGQGSAGVVTFADYSVIAHSKETDDMWQPDLWKRVGNYSANFLYLDGHVEYHEFTSVAGYFKVLHQPIPQTWGSGKIQSMLSAPDVWQPPSGTGG